MPFRDASGKHWEDYICVYVEQFIICNNTWHLFTIRIVECFAARKHTMVRLAFLSLSSPLAWLFAFPVQASYSLHPACITVCTLTT